MSDTGPILSFTGAYSDWSNFALVPVCVFGRDWPTSEHPFQAAKFFGVSDAQVALIAEAGSPGEAKNLGRSRTTPIRGDWTRVAMSVMTMIVLRKFEQNSGLRTRLVASEQSVIVEGNGHGDDLWGAVWVEPRMVGSRPEWAQRNGRVLAGWNQLGKVLMLVRAELREPPPTERGII